MAAAVEFRDFSFTYEGEASPAVSNISFSVERGDVLLIAGKSGSGKSTILRAMIGLIPRMYHGKYCGDVLIEGRPVKETPASELARSIGFVFQNPENQIFAFSVERDIAFGLENQGFSPQEIRERVDWAIKLLGLEPLRKAAPFELSDGQKQRTAIAGVLALKPSMLILDEPTALLDPVTARDVLNLIAALNKELGLTCVIVEHRLELAAPLATKMLVLSEGKVMDFGRVEDVINNPALYQAGISVPPIVELQKAIGVASAKLTVDSFIKEVIKIDAASHKYARQFPDGSRQMNRDCLYRDGSGRNHSAQQNLIKFRNVYFRYRNGVLALSNISLEISAGEVVAVVGTNGSGKTTLIRHLNGLLKPSSGMVSVFGVDTRAVQVSDLSKKVGIVFQNPDHQLFSSTVEDEVMFGLRNFGYPEELARKRAEAAMNFFGLTALKDRPPLTLSGGEKKRVCMAAVLAWEPDILVLDEPTVGQDSVNKKKLYQVIMEYKAAGRTVILVTHDVEFIWPLQPRVLVMSRGSIIRDGSASDVFTDEGVMRSASLTMPQLAELSTKLGISPPATDVKQLLMVRDSWLHT